MKGGQRTPSMLSRVGSNLSLPLHAEVQISISICFRTLLVVRTIHCLFIYLAGPANHFYSHVADLHNSTSFMLTCTIIMTSHAYQKAQLAFDFFAQNPKKTNAPSVRTPPSFAKRN